MLMERDQFISIAKKIAASIQVEQIFGLHYPAPGNTRDHLVILLPASAGVKHTELIPFIDMAIANHEGVTFQLYQRIEFRTALTEGNLYFHWACTTAHELYSEPELPELPKFNIPQLKSALKDANKRFQSGMERTSAFLDGALFYQEKGNPALTAFMLHQFAELTYRTLEIAILNREKRTHDLHQHQQYLWHILPQLAPVFPADTPDEIQMLKSINLAYSAVRYENNYDIEESHILLLFERIKQFKDQAAKIMNDFSLMLLSGCENHSATEQPASDTSTTLPQLFRKITYFMALALDRMATKQQDELQNQ